MLTKAPLLVLLSPEGPRRGIVFRLSQVVHRVAGPVMEVCHLMPFDVAGPGLRLQQAPAER